MLLAPPAVNFRIELRVTLEARKRLPAGSNARPLGLLSPVEAKTRLAPLFVNFKIVPLLPALTTKRLPPASNAMPLGWSSPVAKVVGVGVDAAVSYVTILLPIRNEST